MLRSLVICSSFSLVTFNAFAATCSDTDTNKILYERAIIAKAEQRFTESQECFRILLTKDTMSPLPKLEYAELLYFMKESEASKRLFEEVLLLNPPSNVSANINRYLAQIEAGKKADKRWFAQVSTGVTWDSNANAGPDDETVFLYGLPFTLSDDAMETDDFALDYRVMLGTSQPITEALEWFANASVNGSDYFDVNEMDNAKGTLVTGLTYSQPRYRLSLPIIASGTKYFESGAYYSTSWKLAPQLQYAVTPKLILGMSGDIEKGTYRNNAERNGWRWSLNPSVVYQPFEGGRFQFSPFIGGENTELDIYSNDVWGGSVSYTHEITPRIEATAFASFSNTEFEGIQAAYTEARHDKAYRFGGEVAIGVYEIKDAKLPLDVDLVFSGSYVRNQSNLDLYEYDRMQFGVRTEINF